MIFGNESFINVSKSLNSIVLSFKVCIFSLYPPLLLHHPSLYPPHVCCVCVWRDHVLIASSVVSQTRHDCCNQWEITHAHRRAHTHTHAIDTHSHTFCGRSFSLCSDEKRIDLQLQWSSLRPWHGVCVRERERKSDAWIVMGMSRG